ncbi:MAG: nucleoside triphosphate pyrophosphohydrolase [Gemmatimonadales bacterium]|jgi:MazG family protein|nr:MAG: nucleoside triphosphate pyrophosphohydrolase [Gemmatimonadales bacterium]
MSQEPPDIPYPVAGADHAETAPGTLDRGLALVRFLRANCPWDAAQTAETLVPHLLEEAHEVADAVHRADVSQLEGELGDLLLNLAFQIVVAEEQHRLTADSVTRRLEEKMRRRHPHLYGLGPREDWERLKARERDEELGKDPGGVLGGLARTLDPLTKAHRMQERVAGVGFDWEDHQGAWDKVAEELEEVRVALEAGDEPGVEEELGDLLFAVVNLVRLAGKHPVTALDRANRKFHRRFEGLEALARARGVDLSTASLDRLDQLWDEVKAGEVSDP